MTSFIKLSATSLVMMCALLAQAHALSVSPASHASWVQDGAQGYALKITNDEAAPVSLRLTATGNLADSIAVEHDVLTLAPGESKAVGVHVTIPSSTAPGLLEGGVLIESNPAAGGTVGAVPAVLHVIRLFTPTEGLHVQGQLLYSAARPGGPFTVTVSLLNVGTVAVRNAKATVHLSGPQTETLGTDAITLAPRADGALDATFTPRDVAPYTIRAVVEYDGQELVLEDTVVFGNLSATITDVALGDFTLGEPFRVTSTARSEWGLPLPVTASAYVEQNGKRTEGQALQGTLEPGVNREFSSFIESTGLVKGPATLTSVLYYDGATVTRSVPLIVGEHSLQGGERESRPVAVRMLVIFLILLVIIFGGLWLWRTRRVRA